MILICLLSIYNNISIADLQSDITQLRGISVQLRLFSFEPRSPQTLWNVGYLRSRPGDVHLAVH